MSEVVSSKSYLVSTDIGIFQTHIQQVSGYDIEDMYRDMVISQARALQMVTLGRNIDPTVPTAARSLKSAYLNNDIFLED